MTHPLNLDELVVVDKMRSMCSASGATDKLLLAALGVAGVGSDKRGWDPCADQTSAEVDIDPLVMSCLREMKEDFVLSSVFPFCFRLLQRRHV